MSFERHTAFSDSFLTGKTDNLDFWGFIVSTNLLPAGALVMTLFCVSDRFGWGWENFKTEANAGKGMKVQDWMKPTFKYVVPVVVIGLYVIGLKEFQWK